MRVSGQKAGLYAFGAVLSLFLVWVLAALSVPSYLVPMPGVVVQRLLRESMEMSFWLALFRSLSRLVVGFGLSGFLGISVGLLASTSLGLGAYVRSLVSILQSIPPIAWVPMLIILLGFGDGPILVVIALSAFFPICIGVLNGSRDVSVSQVQLARIMGATRTQLVRKVYAPALLPSILSGLQVGFGNAWRSLIAAEMVGGVNIGIGWSITFFGEVADMSGVLMGILVIGALAAFIERMGFGFLYRRLMPWRLV